MPHQISRRSRRTRGRGGFSSPRAERRSAFGSAGRAPGDRTARSRTAYCPSRRRTEDATGCSRTSLRFLATLLTAFAAVCALSSSACTESSLLAQRRIQEMGIRIALGAQARCMCVGSSSATVGTDRGWRWVRYRRRYAAWSVIRQMLFGITRVPRTFTSIPPVARVDGRRCLVDSGRAGDPAGTYLAPCAADETQRQRTGLARL